jgi:methyltransferase (TIGR00027 family)
MNPQRPSRTAEGAAALRAWHAFVDDRPLVHEDHAVLDLLSPATRLLIQPLPMPMRLGLRRRERLNPMRSALRGQIVIRARWAEDALEAAIERGVDQTVILAAGLDTTALRRPSLLKGVDLYEVDHPATQAWKRKRLGLRAAERIRFVPVEFGVDDLAERLRNAGVDPSRPVFVNWLGCTYYLSAEAMTGTLASLAEFAAPDSEIVLDYWTEHALVAWPSRALLSGLRLAVALQQEPLVGLLSPAGLERLVTSTGWALDADLDAPAQRLRWLAERTDSLSLPDFAHLARLVPAASA